MADSKTPLEPDGIYHIYNHAVGSDLLFYKASNYPHFINLFSKYISDYVNILAYCLMPNHFHFVVQVKSEEEILKLNISKSQNNPTRVQNPRRVNLSTQFGHLFNAYAQAINKQENRKGSLFNNRFKRKLVSDEKYLRNLIHYIHFNPVEAGLVKHIYDWPHSSYKNIISDTSTFVDQKQVIALFDNKENFIFYHRLQPNFDEEDLE